MDQDTQEVDDESQMIKTWRFWEAATEALATPFVELPRLQYSSCTNAVFWVRTWCERVHICEDAKGVLRFQTWAFNSEYDLQNWCALKISGRISASNNLHVEVEEGDYIDFRTGVAKGA